MSANFASAGSYGSDFNHYSEWAGRKEAGEVDLMTRKKLFLWPGLGLNKSETDFHESYVALLLLPKHDPNELDNWENAEKEMAQQDWIKAEALWLWKFLISLSPLTAVQTRPESDFAWPKKLIENEIEFAVIINPLSCHQKTSK